MAGVSGMPVGRFVGTAAAGAAIWGGTYLLAGYLFHNQLEAVSEIAERMGSWFTILISGLIALYLGTKYYQRRRFIRSLRAVRITAEELAEEIRKGEALAIIDLRHNFEVELDGTKLPHAIRIEPSELDRRIGEIPRNKEIVLYCS
jgi:hypothetical protein